MISRLWSQREPTLSVRGVLGTPERATVQSWSKRWSEDGSAASTAGAIASGAVPHLGEERT